MALVTRCPHCRALFRVDADQLASHNGMVRCGSCRQVFNAVSHLDYVGQAADARPGSAPASPSSAPGLASSTAARAATPTPRASASPPPVAWGADPRGLAPSAAPLHAVPPSAARPAPAPAAASSAASPAAPMPATARGEPALPESSPGPATERPAREPAAASASTAPRSERRAKRREPEPAPDELAADTILDQIFLPSTPGAEDAEEGEAPIFLREVSPGRQRATRIFFGAGSALLAAILLVQATLLFRADLLAHDPELHPLLSSLCEALGCSAQWPMRPEYLAVVSSEMQALPGTSALELDAVIRNRADFPMSLPAIELTLTDNFDHTVGRKVFQAGEYQATSPGLGRVESIAAGGDLTVRIQFSSPSPSVSGFVAYPFYP